MSHVRKSLAAASVLNTAVFVIEGLAGYRAGSMSLLMDSIHNLSDELALVCLVLAYTVSLKLSRNLQRFANLLNSVGLVVISAVLIVQAIDRIRHSSPVLALIPAVVGVLAAIGNWCVARVLRDVRNQNPAIRLAYIHNLGDTYVSLVPVLAGALVWATGLFAFDPIIGIGIALWFIWSTVQEVRSSGEQLLWPEDAVCKHPTVQTK
ncbi:MAG TPA: cation diffusion facilitator family transporter [Bacteroidota bacterium]|nr:cation diffusion facilitator family transporter [Bacteroidota bacterium]